MIGKWWRRGRRDGGDWWRWWWKSRDRCLRNRRVMVEGEVIGGEWVTSFADKK